MRTTNTTSSRTGVHNNVQAWLEAEWGVSDNNRQVKFYRLTRRGREYLQRESSGWKEFAAAVFKVLQTT